MLLIGSDCWMSGCGISHQQHVSLIMLDVHIFANIFASTGYLPGAGKAPRHSPEGVQAVQRRMQNLMLLPGITK